MEIRILRDSERIEALQLAREVFLGFEAPEYSEEGVREFLGYLDRRGFTVYKCLAPFCGADWPECSPWPQTGTSPFSLWRSGSTVRESEGRSSRQS